MSTTSATSSTNSILQTYLNTQSTEQAADAANAASSSASSSNALASSTSASSIGSNFNEFINILTTQLQNQDPTNATDPNQFTQELVEFAGVEQQLNTNNDLQTLITLGKNSSGANAALNYMGQYVESAGTSGQLSLQNGTSEFGYTLPADASSATIKITNSRGDEVASFSAPTTSGLNYVSWNGQTSSGTQEADGAYTWTISATNASTGAAETITDFRVLGQVTGVTSNTDGSTSLTLGSGTSVATSTIDAIYGTKTTNMPTATAETATSS